MDRESVRLKAQEIFRSAFNMDDLVIHDAMVAKDVPVWDSLNHMVLIVSLEEAFKVKFGTREVMGWKSVGEMLDSLLAKLS